MSAGGAPYAHYFFNVETSPRPFRDEEGTNHNNLQSAREEAIDFVIMLTRDQIDGVDRREFATVVRDKDGNRLFRARLLFIAEWLTPEPNGPGL